MTGKIIEGARRRPRGISTIAYEIRSSGQHRTAQIAGALAEQEINIHAILQKPGHTKANLPFVVIVEPCPSSALKRALGKIAMLDCLLEPTLDLQILEPEAEA